MEPWKGNHSGFGLLEGAVAGLCMGVGGLEERGQKEPQCRERRGCVGPGRGAGAVDGFVSVPELDGADLPHHIGVGSS